MPSKNISILVADPQYLIRLGVVHLLAQYTNLHLIATVDNSAQLLSLSAKHHPQLIIFDYHKAPNFSIDDLAVLQKQSPSSKVLIISADNNPQTIFKALEYGVNGFLTKQCDQTEIIGAIYASVKGEKFFCNKVLKLLLQKENTLPSNTSISEDCTPSKLTKREIEILQLVAQGLATKDVAQKLFLSPHTVATHRKNIMRKLHLNSATELTIYAIKMGFIAAG